MGFKDKNGEILQVHNDDSMYMSDCMHFLNSLAKKTATYKYAFFKSILDNLFNVNDNLELDFKYLSYSFSKMYWNLIAKYKLPQYQNGNSSIIEKYIYDIIENNNLLDEVDEIFGCFVSNHFVPIDFYIFLSLIDEVCDIMEIINGDSLNITSEARKMLIKNFNSSVYCK